MPQETISPAQHANGDDPPDKLTDMLVKIVERAGEDPVSLGMLVDAFRYRASGALLFLFADPNVLPVPPGTSGTLGIPLVIIAYQLLSAGPQILPNFIMGRALSGETFGRMVQQTVPRLNRVERLLCPRMARLTADTAERVIGGFCLLLAVILTLPIPLGNMLPAFAVSIIAFGMMERDGIWIILGFAVGIVSIVIVGGVVWGMVLAALFLVAIFLV
jgi:hypothetical protein